MPNVQHKRGTRAALVALAGANGLLPGQVYLCTDEGRLAVALTTSTFETFAKESEAGGGGGAVTVTEVQVVFVTPAPARVFAVAVPGALITQRVLASISANMPAGLNRDELEADPITVSGAVTAPDTVTLVIASTTGSPICGARNINLILG